MKMYPQGRKVSGALLVAPWLILIGFVGLLALPPTRRMAERLLLENHPVELLTFLLLLYASTLAASVARQAAKHSERVVVVAFYVAFAALAFFVAMEEISWGQQFLGFATPAVVESINVQGELTLHNYQGHNSAFELFIFGAAGLVGLALTRIDALRQITPPPVMLSWFIAIILAGGADAFTDQSDKSQLHIYVIAWIGEVVEMLVAMAAALYMWLKKNELVRGWTETCRTDLPEDPSGMAN
jgi:hypothetical protein